MTLGETIKLLRTEQGLTQPELAEKARIEQSYLSKVENDKGIPSFDIINRLAQALGLTGMGLINKLSHSYISEHLSHLPEVAAEYASVMEKRERNTNRQLLLAGVLLLVGTALVLSGYQQLFATDQIWFYESKGVLKEGEHYLRFVDGGLHDINETPEERDQRLLENRGRIDLAYMQLHDNMGPYFLQEVEGGKRWYFMQDQGYSKRPLNTLLEIVGSVTGLAGVLVAAHTLWRHHSR